MNGAGFYFEVAPGWVWIGGGLWRPDTSQLQLVREHIVEQSPRVRDDRQVAAASRSLAACKATRMTRVPRGFAKDHPAAAYLQHRQFMAYREEAAAFATKKDFYKQLRTTLETITPLVRFLNEPLVAALKTGSARAHLRRGVAGGLKSASSRLAATIGSAAPGRTAPRRRRAPRRPAIRCAWVAPARMPSATIDARTGITGPNGTVNVGGFTTWSGSVKCAPTCAAISRSRLRSTSVDRHTARYITSRAMALTAASATNVPDSARINATPAPNRIALDGVR